MKNTDLENLPLFPKNTDKIMGYCGFEICTLDGRDEAELGFRLIKSERVKDIVELTSCTRDEK